MECRTCRNHLELLGVGPGIREQSRISKAYFTSTCSTLLLLLYAAMGNLLSTSSKPRLYNGIKLLLVDPEKRFPLEFNPQDPFEEKKLKQVSRESFIDKVKSEEGVGVVPLEEFSPEGIEEETAKEVELRDGATYIVIPCRRKRYEKRVSSFAAFFIVVGFQFIADLGSKIK
jgi:hypothetical protein